LALLPLMSAGVFAIAEEEAPDPLSPERLEAEEVVIANIVLEKQDVFDLSNPKENNALYRLANKLHIITKDSVIEQQLLIKPGDTVSKRLIEETERILRRNTYFYDASITAKNRQDGSVDLHVNTRDVWTLKPGFSFSRSGGENRTLIKLEELNLLGRGQQLLVARSSDVDRDSTLFTFRDRNLGNSWTSLRFHFAENSDGDSTGLSVIRPFFSLDARWAAGVTASDNDLQRALYELGEKAAEFQHERSHYTAFGGWSAGLQNGWVRRFTAGVAFDDNRFSEVVNGTLPAAIPEDRKLVYPFFGIEILENRFETAQNRNQIERTEDFLTGTRFAATLGWSDEEFGADRDAALYWLSASRTFGTLAETALLMSGSANGRYESGDLVNALLNVRARYYRQQSKQRTFFATTSASYGENLDLDNPVELGGDTGLRGYPLRYQSGDSRMLVSVEQRYFWDWYPFRLFRVGGAIFADAGRVWGDNPLGGENLGWLADVGFGLRFQPTRTGTRSIIHLDIAFPLNGDESIDSVQFLLESKRSF
jgi:hemolysin activation/secretion protein